MASAPGTKRYYKHSGKVPIFGLLLTPIAGGVAAVSLAFVYGYAIYWIPFVYLNFMLTALLGFGIGFAVAWAAKAGKVRNGGFAAVVGLAAGAVAMQVQWGAWLAANEIPGLLTEPAATWAIMKEVAELGPWGIFGWIPTGGALWTIWGIEAAMIVGIATFGSYALVDDQPFCETCNTWMPDPQVLEPFDRVSNPERLKVQLERGDFSPLTAFERVMDTTAEFCSLKLSICQGCLNLRILSVGNVSLSISDGEEKRSETAIVSHLLLDASTYDAISKL